MAKLETVRDIFAKYYLILCMPVLESFACFDMLRRMLNATVLRRLDIADNLAIFHVLPDAGVPNYKPGQYVALGLTGGAARPDDFPIEIETPHPDKLIKRAYSLGSTPEQREYLEFYIAIVREGLLTSRLALVKDGDRVYVAPKITGTFITEEVPDENNLVLVSTGTGVAPYLSMLRTESTWTKGRHISLIHGVRHEADLAYREELLTLQKERPSFTYYAFTSRDESKDDIRKGYVQSLFSNGELLLNADKDHVFLCGNPAMVEDVEKLLSPMGYEVHTKRKPGKLHLEKYW